MTETRKIRALVLFSGGLDSILAVKILEEQGIDVVALTYVSYFFDAEQAERSAKENGIKLRVEDFSEKHFEIVKKPRYGHGVGMNPCIDCHLMMLREAKKIMESGIFSPSRIATRSVAGRRTRENSTILATGEVLGQRPMSQNIEALKLIEREAGLVGKILRPLSALVLPETEMEKGDWGEKGNRVDRNKLFGISGRSRKGQIDLAKKYKIKYFPTPAGGCILTEKVFAGRLEKLIKETGGDIGKLKETDFKLLRIGRHFWSGKNLPAGRQARIILGRKHEENLKLRELAEEGDCLLEFENIPGPLALIRGKITQDALEMAKEKIINYAKKADKMEKKFKTLKI